MKISGHFGPVVDEDGAPLPGTMRMRRGVLPRERRAREALKKDIANLTGTGYDGISRVDPDTQFRWRGVKRHLAEE